MARKLGFTLYGWQSTTGDVGTERVGGLWRRRLVDASTPRQSGKTRLSLAVMIDRCLEAPCEVFYTAQRHKDASIRWDDFRRILRGSRFVELEGFPRFPPADGSWDYRLHSSTGRQSIEFANGSLLRIFSPVTDALHGSTAALVMLDEARFHDQVRGHELLAAALPATATVKGQVWIVSTAGDDRSTFLHEQLEAARAAAGDLHAERCIAEWAVDRAAVDGVDDLDVLARIVHAAHPAGRARTGPDLRSVQLAVRTQPRAAFLREWGNAWATRSDRIVESLVIPALVWARTVAEEPMPGGEPCFGVDVHPDRSSSAVVAINKGVAQLVDHEPGADWVLGRVRELAARWNPPVVALDEAGPAGNIAERLRFDLGQTVVSTNSRQWGQACAALHDALSASPARLLHRPSEELDRAAGSVTKRRLGSSWCIDRYSSSVSPCLGALALAVHAQQQLELGPEQSKIFV